MKKILIARSAARIFDRTIDSLKSEFSDSEITAIVPPSLLEVIKKDHRINEVISINRKGQMSIFKINSALKSKLKEKKFDIGVSLYNYEGGLGYCNIELMLYALNVKELRSYNVNGDKTIIKPKNLLAKLIKEKTNFIWIPINWIMIFLLFSIITTGILSEWIFRKMVEFIQKLQKPKLYQM